MAEELVGHFGDLVGRRIAPRAEITDKHGPVLRRYDAWGQEANVIEHHSTWTDNKADLVRNGFVVIPTRDGRPAPGVVVAARAYLVCQAETAIYCASKGGVSNLTRSLARELAPKLVRVNAVCPNDVETPMLEGQARVYGGGDPEGYYRALLARYPQGERARFIKPDEVAALIAYLASDEAAPITGACIAIDFGSTASL